ncbi:hypothetical protein FITA111629_01585 [Filibacter tadaridae]|uniref:Uncharacterized protein n=1 Tax=Filibacter tadaridae TaxID=2483811 RepID=A0A3P5XHH8_9BACL|nr:hypothetical protein [Filibacter tadaridae]VDC29593.1 hypothetical protein FILTAD_02164 [Filibacter tadaridae]
MKQVGIILGIVVVAVAVFIFVNKSYYPSLPIDNLSAKEAIEKLKNSDAKIVEVATDNDSLWYITKIENKDISIADDNIKQMIGSRGWEFKDKDGAGLFFEKDGERLIVTTQMWTKKYVLVQVQKKFKEL